MASEANKAEEAANAAPESKINDKEYNFRALEAKYQRQLEQERQEKTEAQRIAQLAQETLAKMQYKEDEEDDSEPYVDYKKLERKLAKAEEKIDKKTDSKIQEIVQRALQEERKQNWIKQNSDFYEGMNNAERLAVSDPELAETILQMPDNFERQKLVYKNIKALGLHQPTPRQPSIQEKIDNNRKPVYYQPSGIPNAPYAAAGDFSETGQKSAYDQMKKLQKQLRI